MHYQATRNSFSDWICPRISAAQVPRKRVRYWSEAGRRKGVKLSSLTSKSGIGEFPKSPKAYHILRGFRLGGPAITPILHEIFILYPQISSYPRFVFSPAPISFICYFGRMNDQKFFTECYLRTLRQINAIRSNRPRKVLGRSSAYQSLSFSLGVSLPAKLTPLA
jgi:hypothetical protein